MTNMWSSYQILSNENNQRIHSNETKFLKVKIKNFNIQFFLLNNHIWVIITGSLLKMITAWVIIYSYLISPLISIYRIILYYIIDNLGITYIKSKIKLNSSYLFLKIIFWLFYHFLLIKLIFISIYRYVLIAKRMHHHIFRIKFSFHWI